MEKYEFLDHTADAEFRAYGKNLEDAFVNAAEAMYKILLKDVVIKPAEKKLIVIESKTKESLLFDFLDELLFLMDTETIVLSKIEGLKIVKDNNYKLTCDAFFDNAPKYDIGGNIKSVTYHELKIIEEENKVSLQVVVDI